MAYNSLRDRHGSSVGGAPIGFVKSGPDEYRSRDDLWVIKHRYKSGYQAHHEWYVTAPDGSNFNNFTNGRYYLCLSDAVQAVNESVALGVVNMLKNFYKRLWELETKRLNNEAAVKLRTEREQAVLSVLNDYGVNTAVPIAEQIVDKLFGMTAPNPV